MRRGPGAEPLRVEVEVPAERVPAAREARRRRGHPGMEAYFLWLLFEDLRRLAAQEGWRGALDEALGEHYDDPLDPS